MDLIETEWRADVTSHLQIYMRSGQLQICIYLKKKKLGGGGGEKSSYVKGAVFCGISADSSCSTVLYHEGHISFKKLFITDSKM